MTTIFFSYSHHDAEFRDELEKHLSPLMRDGIITTWHDQRIEAGREFAREIDILLESADIILLLVSSNFLSSDYCYDIEMRRAMERHETGSARVIPVILDSCDWHGAPFGKLLATPPDGKPVSSFPNQHDAFLEITKAIRNVVQALRGVQQDAQSPTGLHERHAAVTPSAGSATTKGAIPLPHRGLVGRADILRELTGLLVGFTERPAGDSYNVVSLQGMPGLGKSALAVAVIYDPEVRLAYNDTIIWQSIGKNADPWAIVSQWCYLLGAAHLLKQPDAHQGTDPDAAAKAVGEQLRAFLLRSETRALFVLDDVWHARHLEPILVAGGCCATLITTRSLTIAEEFAPSGQRKQPTRLSPSESRELLSRLVDQEIVANFHPDIDDLLERLDGLPLAITVAGGLLSRASSRGHSIDGVIEQLRNRTDILLTQPVPTDVRQFMHDVEDNPNLVALLQLSTDELDEHTRECFAVLGDAAPTNEGTFGLKWMASGWGLPLQEAQNVADRLVESGLMQHAKTVRGMPYFYMHDLLVQYAKTMVDPDHGRME
jgi:hypothetical protein